MREVGELLGPDVIVEAARAGSTGIEADPASPLFDTIQAVMGDVDPGSVVAPFLVSGTTLRPP